MRRIIAICAVLLLAFASSRAEAKNNPRDRLHKLSVGEYTEADVEAEREFGRQVAARILGRFPLLDDAPLTRYVGLLGTGLAEAGGRGDLEFKFAVLDTDVPNAFAAPGGYVFVTRGALTRMRDEAELSAVLAHEIAHVSRRHIVRELNLRGGGGDLAGGLARIIGGAGEVSRVAMSKLVDAAEELLFSKGYAQKDEFEADGDALALVGAVGYDPGGLDRYLERNEKESRGSEPASLKATHPSYADRKARIARTLLADGLDKAKGPAMKERFDENVKAR